MASPQRWNDMAAVAHADDEYDDLLERAAHTAHPAGRSPSPGKGKGKGKKKKGGGAAGKPTAAGEAKRIVKLLKGGTPERREAFAALTAVAKAPGGKVLLEDEFEVDAGKIMLPCVHVLLAVLSEPAKPLPPSVSGAVSILVDEKMAKAIKSARAAEHLEQPEDPEDHEEHRENQLLQVASALEAIIKSIKAGPKIQAVHDEVKPSKKWETTVSVDEWRDLAAAIVKQLPCRFCRDATVNPGGLCRGDCRECARLMRREKVLANEERARLRAVLCAEAAAVLELVVAADTAVESNVMYQHISEWSSPVGLLLTGLDCPPNVKGHVEEAVVPKTPKAPTGGSRSTTPGTAPGTPVSRRGTPGSRRGTDEKDAGKKPSQKKKGKGGGKAKKPGTPGSSGKNSPTKGRIKSPKKK